MSLAYATAIKDYFKQMRQLGTVYMPFARWLENQKLAGKYWEVANKDYY